MDTLLHDRRSVLKRNAQIQVRHNPLQNPIENVA